MSSSDLISFKVYFDKGSGSENNWEVRRFGIENNVATSFSYLTEKLKAVFPYLKNVSDIHVYWKDTDNDSVKISSDAELIIALTEIEQPIKKLYIKVMPSNNLVDDVADHVQYSSSTPNGDGDGWPVMHAGVICDCCDAPVIGFRYKCLQCPNYDLCSACESRSYHPEHYMLRMPTPTQVVKSCGRSKRGNLSHKKWNHAGLLSTAIADSACPFTKRYGRKHVKRITPITSIDSNRSVVSNLIPLFEKVCANVLDGLLTAPADNACQQDVNENDNDNSKEKSDTAAAACSSTSGDNNVASGITVENVAFKKTEGKPQEQCSSGIKNENSNTNQNESNRTPAADSNMNINDPQEMIAKIIKSVIPVISDMLKQDILNQDNGNINNIENKSTSQSSNNNQDNDGNVAAANAAISEMLMGNDGIRVKAAEQEQVVQQKDEDNGWTLLSKEKDITGIKSTGAIPKTIISNTTGENKNLNESNNVSSPNDANGSNSDQQQKGQAKYRNSLKSMLDMGFTNEGNWLGDLLAKNDCNVAKVIELLTVPGRRGHF